MAINIIGLNEYFLAEKIPFLIQRNVEMRKNLKIEV